MKDLPSVEQLPFLLEAPDGLLLQPTRLYDRNKEQILLTLQNPAVDKKHFFTVSFSSGDAESKKNNNSESFPSALITATVTASDPTFFQHNGCDLSQLLGNGNATITQQLISDVLLQKEMSKKQQDFSSCLLAIDATKRYGREKILEWYLNSTYYGNLAYGADAASQTYFNKSAADLSLAEAAMLAAINLAPSLNPINAPKAARERQLNLLQKMLKNQVITPEEAAHAAQEEIHINPKGREYPQSAIAAEFTDYVLNQLDSKYDRHKIERGGLNIVTTLDIELQKKINCIQTDVSSGISSAKCSETHLLNGQQVKLTGSDDVVILDPRNGQLLALASNPARNNTLQILPEHTIGTVLTPIYTLTAFSEGYSPATLVWDIPPKNNKNLLSNYVYHGPVRYRLALANDYIVPLMETFEKIGIRNILSTIQEIGINIEPSNSNDIDILLNSKVNLIEVCQAYSTMANQGTLTGKDFNNDIKKPYSKINLQPSAILEIQNTKNETLLNWENTEAKPISSAQLTYLVTNILNDRTARWHSLGHPNPLEIDRPVAVKSSISLDGNTAWTIGYNPQRVIGVVYEASSQDQNAAADANQLWHLIANASLQGLEFQDFNKPAGIIKLEVCDPSGLLPTDACPNTVHEIFIEGNQPTQRDTLFQNIPINIKSGKMATTLSHPSLVENKVFMNIPSEAMDWAKSAGVALPPHTYDILPESSTNNNQVWIDSPKMFTIVHGDVHIIGSAESDGFDFYRVQIGKGLFPTAWLQVSEDVYHPKRNTLLATWNTENSNGLYTIQLLVINQDHTVKRHSIFVTVDNTPPKVEIIYPTNDQSVELKQGQNITILADIQDNHIIKIVRFKIDGESIAVLTSQPFAVNWHPIPGKHTLSILAEDQAGNTTEKSIDIEIIIR